MLKRYKSSRKISGERKIWKVVRKQIKKSYEINFYTRKTISARGGAARRRHHHPAARGELAGGGRQELAHRRSLEERATAVAELAWRRSPLLYSGSELLLLRASAPPSPGALPLLRSICKLGRLPIEKRERERRWERCALLL